MTHYTRNGLIVALFGGLIVMSGALASDGRLAILCGLILLSGGIVFAAISAVLSLRTTADLRGRDRLAADRIATAMREHAVCLQRWAEDETPKVAHHSLDAHIVGAGVSLAEANKRLLDEHDG